MAPFNNVGGSITGALALTMLAWGIRLFRAMQHRRKAQEDNATPIAEAKPKFMSSITPAALRMLVSLGPLLRHGAMAQLTTWHDNLTTTICTCVDRHKTSGTSSFRGE